VKFGCSEHVRKCLFPVDAIHMPVGEELVETGEKSYMKLVSNKLMKFFHLYITWRE
jgi:hypothetical protein